ncbi:MAG: DUF2207 domain-containing protein [Bacilli bacterium]|nr:DUF2207 domain-containing protein [Bacilli bacterium]
MRKYTGLVVIIVWIIFIYLITFLGSMEVESDGSSYARITDFEYKAELVDEVNQQGKVIITERITYDIHVENVYEEIWELWRDMPESVADGVRNTYKVNSVKEIRPDGTEIVYTESDKLYWYDDDYVNTGAGYGPGKWFYSPGPYDEDYRQYECVLFYVNGLKDGEITFEIEYEMTGAAFKYADCSYLYLTFFSGNDVNYLESFKAEVLIRNKDMPKVGNYEAYNYGTVDMHYPYVESDTKYPGYHTFTMELDEEDLKFDDDSEFLEFEMWSFNEDKAIFSEHAPINYYSNDNVLDEIRETQQYYYSIPIKKKRTKATILIVCGAVGLLIALDAYTKEKKVRKKYIFCNPTKQVLYCKEAPSNLDPYFAANLVFCKDNKKFNEDDAYSAILLSLVRKEYIELAQIRELNDWSQNNVKIVIKYQPTQIYSMPSNPNIIRSNQWYPTQNTNFFANRMNGTIPTMYNRNYYNNSVMNNNNYVNSTNINNVEPEILDVSASDIKKYEPLTLTEQYYFNLIVRHAIFNEIEMKKFQRKIEDDYENTDTFVTNIENSVSKIGTTQGYFQRANYDKPKKDINAYSNFLIFIAVLLLTLGNIYSYETYGHFAYGGITLLGLICIACSMHLKKIAPKFVLLTQFGEDEYAKWRGFYEFLNSEDFMNDRSVVELPMWEQYLVYATAFGLSAKVSKAIGIRCQGIQPSPMLSNTYYRSTHFHHSSRSFRSAASRASYTSRSGGYSYSSGGRGGGGGGGGH